jgi:hypothetical protein
MGEEAVRFESSAGFVRMMLSAYMDFRPDRTASANNDNPEETVAAGIEKGGLRLRSLFSTSKSIFRNPRCNYGRKT